MNVGMRVRGGMLAALIMLATPVAATLVAPPAFAQAVSSIQVEGNRRVEVETIRSYFKPGPGGRLDQGLQAVIDMALIKAPVGARLEVGTDGRNFDTPITFDLDGIHGLGSRRRRNKQSRHRGSNRHGDHDQGG